MLNLEIDRSPGEKPDNVRVFCVFQIAPFVAEGEEGGEEGEKSSQNVDLEIVFLSHNNKSVSAF